MDTNLQHLPKMDKILKESSLKAFPAAVIKYSSDIILNDCRRKGVILSYDEIIKKIYTACSKILSSKLQPVINATGVVIHTNLGRAPLGVEILSETLRDMAGYVSLEYNMDTGTRGDRYNHCADLLRIISGAEDAVIVNNNGAALYLILNTLSYGKETILSRGELVEIGGKFRIPDVMVSAGAILKEVGTTNKTYTADYEKAITGKTGLIAKIAKSNYSITGFTEEVSWEDIPKIGKKHKVISYYDAGCCLFTPIDGIDLPTVKDITLKGYDIFSFSGDKLTGAIQCGIILGKKDIIEKLKKNNTIRILRPDKVTISLLFTALKHYLYGNQDCIPTVKMFKENIKTLKERALYIMEVLGDRCRVEEVTSPLGGGSAPDIEIKDIAIKIDCPNPDKLVEALRCYKVPVIARIKDGKVIIAMRSVLDEELDTLKSALEYAFTELGISRHL